MSPPDDGSPGIGHNTSGEEAQIKDNLATKYDHMRPQTDELLSNAALLPEVIPEDQIGRWQDLAKSMRSQWNALDNARAVEKAPYDRAAGVVQNFFIDPMGRIEAMRKKVADKVTVAKEKLKDRLKAEAEEVARKKREEAERIADQKRRDEAEKRRIEEEAELERQRVQREKEATERQRIAKIEEQRKADEAALQKLEDDRKEEERKAKEAAERLAEATRKRQRDAAQKIIDDAAAAQKVIDDEKARTTKEAADRQAVLDHQNRRASHDDQLRLDAATRTAEAAGKDTNRAARDTEKAENKQATAVALEKKIESADGGEFGRTRGDFGSVGTLRKEWAFANIAVAALDLEKLRHHIPLDGYERAIRAMIKTGITECAGVDIFQQDALAIR